MLAFSQALCLVDGGDYVDGLEQIQKVREAAPGSKIVQLTFEHLKDRAAADAKEQAKDQAKDRAGRAIGGLLGRKRAPPPRSRPRPAC
jgi:hypothetical protein